MDSELESKLGTLLIKFQEAVSIQTTLLYINHPQPVNSTQLITDNYTEIGIAIGSVKQKSPKQW